MRKIELQISDDLAQRLSPHLDNLPALLEAGLQAWQQDTHPIRGRLLHERIHRLLAASGRVQAPKPYPETESAYSPRTPVSISGQPVSEIVIEQRGPR